MIRLLIFRFLPALLPLIAYGCWYILLARRTRKEGKPRPSFYQGSLYWAILASLSIAALCFILMGMEQQQQKGVYVPPSLQDDRIMPGHVEP